MKEGREGGKEGGREGRKEGARTEFLVLGRILHRVLNRLGQLAFHVLKATHILPSHIGDFYVGLAQGGGVADGHGVPEVVVGDHQGIQKLGIDLLLVNINVAGGGREEGREEGEEGE